jgi:hypothetical protein
MKRRTLDKIISIVSLGFAALLLLFAGLLNWGASFADDNVASQLSMQNISFPAVESLPAATKDQLTKWADQKVVTGEMARDYSDLYILEHMNASATAVMGKPATYSEVSGIYMGLVRGGSTDVEKIKQYGDLRETLFMGNTLRGMLLQAYAFGTMGIIAGYAALASLGGAILFLILGIAAVLHRRHTSEEVLI